MTHDKCSPVLAVVAARLRQIETEIPRRSLR